MRACEVEMLDGKVACPCAGGGRVGVETCYRCSHLRAFYDEGAHTHVVCAPPLRLGLRRGPRRPPSPVA